MDSHNSDSKVLEDRNIFIIIGFISFSVLAFLVWLIYFKPGADLAGEISWVSSLPVLNAFLNTLTSILLVTGLTLIRQNKIDWHKRAMFAATGSSAIFLVSYITYHHFHGDTKFIATGLIRPIYFGILISHILLSAIQVPLILSTLYLALTKKFVRHKKVARVTFPIWLYVSVTGILIFIILRWFNV
jgi:putative membrane protein